MEGNREIAKILIGIIWLKRWWSIWRLIVSLKLIRNILSKMDRIFL
jgi:hypothetical protein